MVPIEVLDRVRLAQGKWQIVHNLGAHILNAFYATMLLGVRCLILESDE